MLSPTVALRRGSAYKAHKVMPMLWRPRMISAQSWANAVTRGGSCKSTNIQIKINLLTHEQGWWCHFPESNSSERKIFEPTSSSWSRRIKISSYDRGQPMTRNISSPNTFLFSRWNKTFVDATLEQIRSNKFGLYLISTSLSAFELYWEVHKKVLSELGEINCRTDLSSHRRNFKQVATSSKRLPTD